MAAVDWDQTVPYRVAWVETNLDVVHAVHRAEIDDDRIDVRTGPGHALVDLKINRVGHEHQGNNLVGVVEVPHKDVA